METNTDGGNDEADGESKEKLLQKISDLQLLLTGRDDIIDALKLDLGREKKLNDILMDQIVLLKTDKRKGLPFNISDLSSDSSDDESLIQAAQEQKRHHMKVARVMMKNLCILLLPPLLPRLPHPLMVHLIQRMMVNQIRVISPKNHWQNSM